MDALFDTESVEAWTGPRILILLETIDWPDERVLSSVMDDVVTRLSPIAKDDIVDRVPATRMNPATCRFETSSV